MYFHEKVMHVADHAADFLFSKVYFWMPAVAAASAAGMLLMSGPMVLPHALGLVAPILGPLPQPSVFGQSMPRMPSQEEMEAMEEDMQ
jgi:hypothetical protein